MRVSCATALSSASVDGGACPRAALSSVLSCASPAWCCAAALDASASTPRRALDSASTRERKSSTVARSALSALVVCSSFVSTSTTELAALTSASRASAVGGMLASTSLRLLRLAVAIAIISLDRCSRRSVSASVAEGGSEAAAAGPPPAKPVPCRAIPVPCRAKLVLWLPCRAIPVLWLPCRAMLAPWLP